MKKIKILRGFIITLSILIIIRLVALAVYVPFDHNKLLVVVTNFPILLFVGLIYIERGLYYNMKIGYFNTKSVLKLKRGGLFLIFFGLITLIKGIGMFFVQSNIPEIKALAYQSIVSSFLISIVGFSLIVFSDFIKKGNKIQTENDLTI